MKLTVIAFLIFIGFACSKETKLNVTDPVPTIPPAADTIFSARTGHAVVAFKDKLWLFGGLSQSGNNNDVWSSVNGISWKLEIKHAAFTARNNHKVVIQNNKLWLAGGSSDGNNREIWSSVDGVNWVTESSSVPFLPQGYFGMVVYKDRFLANGGISGSVNGQFVGLSDILWTSADGKSWANSGTSPFGERFGHSFLEFKDKIWLVGGASDKPDSVWSSNDGLKWDLQTPKAGFGTQISAGVLVYKNELFLLAGHTPREAFGGRTNEVWSSPDGINWREIIKNAAFSPRTGHQAVTFKDKIFLIGGDSGIGTRRDIDVLKNEIWTSTNGSDWLLANKGN